MSAETDGETDDVMPAQALVNLLARLGQVDAAIDVAAEHLAGYPDSSLACPGVAQLCLRANQPERLAQIARSNGDLVTYTAAALVQAGAGKL